MDIERKTKGEKEISHIFLNLLERKEDGEQKT